MVAVERAAPDAVLHPVGSLLLGKGFVDITVRAAHTLRWYGCNLTGYDFIGYSGRGPLAAFQPQMQV